MASDKEVFLQHIQDHKGIIYKICRSYCNDKDSREDLAQEIVYNLWKALPTYNPSYKFSTWMYRVALNVAISFYRKERKHEKHIPILEEMCLFEQTNEGEEVEDNLKLLEQFIKELGEIDKSIMLLYLDDKTYKEIAAITGIGDSNISTRINRIKNKLKITFASYQNK